MNQLQINNHTSLNWKTRKIASHRAVPRRSDPMSKEVFIWNKDIVSHNLEYFASGSGFQWRWYFSDESYAHSPIIENKPYKNKEAVIRQILSLGKVVYTDIFSV